MTLRRSMLAWDNRRKEYDTCPWPGPRPLRPAGEAEGDDAERLIGREEHRRDLLRDISRFRLTVLTADSGVGKSSLLNAGLLPDLRDAGFEPLIIRNWSPTRDDFDNVDQFLYRRLESQLPDDFAADDNVPFSERLDAALGDAGVVILDQFEELIRFDDVPMHTKVQRWVADASLSRRFKVVISLRSEYAHRLRPLEQRIRSRGMTTYRLEPLTDSSVVEKICASGQLNGQPAIDGPSTAEIVNAWKQAVDAHRVPTHVGLLHLQALLYSLHHIANRSTITTEHLQTLLTANRADPSGGVQPSPEWFELGLRKAVEVKLEHCEKACNADEDRPLTVDDTLTIGARNAVQRAVGHLCSGGYKLDREVWDLAEVTLRRELQALVPSPTPRHDEALAKLVRLLCGGRSGSPTDLLALSHRDLATSLPAGIVDVLSIGAHGPQLGNWLDVLESSALQASGTRDVSAGVMMGLPHAHIVLEELRRFAFGISWLESQELIRRTVLGDGRVMLSLVHDGVGAALNWWADQEDSKPDSALSFLTAAVGEEFNWKRADGRRHDALDAEDGTPRRVYANVVWRSCRVSADFRNITFVNCDFRQTEFVDCTFDGAVFVNCLLDGTILSNCTIVGTPAAPKAPANDDHKHLPPTFSVGYDPTRATTFWLYRDRPNPADTPAAEAANLYSLTSGVPALPIEAEQVPHPVTHEVSHDTKGVSRNGGLAMYGGRLCSLLIRRCTMTDGGEVSFSSVSGSSLDIVEQRTGSFRLFQCLVRGLCITTSVDRDAGEYSGGATLTVEADDCTLADTWIGSGISGSITLTNCVLWNVVNAATNADLVTVDDCAHAGLVNVTPPANPPITIDITADESSAKVKELAYRSSPAVLRLRQLREQPL
jgi:hypothetical protein